MPEIFTGTVDKPGLYPDVPEDKYHADPVPEGSLSHSGMKLLLPPNCPADYDWARRHPYRPTRAMELGTVVHGMILGTGQDVAVLDFENRRGNAYKEAETKALKAGQVPMLAKDYAEAKAIADAVKAHDTAGALFQDGDAEVSMFARDEEFGIWLRGRTDWLTFIDGQPVIVDLKTAADASDDARAKSAADQSYYIQDPVYRRILAAILHCDPEDIDFVFVVVQTSGRHQVRMHRLHPLDYERGRARARQAMEIYRDCSQTGVWPDHPEDIDDLSLPAYARSRIDRSINDWHGILFGYDF
jgi:hypothetical protein